MCLCTHTCGWCALSSHHSLTLSLLQLSSIVHRTMKEADEDKDDFIDFEEFKKVCTSAVVHADHTVDHQLRFSCYGSVFLHQPCPKLC